MSGPIRINITVFSIILLLLTSTGYAASDTATGTATLTQSTECEPGDKFIKNNSIYRCNSEGLDSYLVTKCEADENAGYNNEGELRCIKEDVNTEEDDSSGSPLGIISILALIGLSGYWLGKNKNSE